MEFKTKNRKWSSRQKQIKDGIQDIKKSSGQKKTKVWNREKLENISRQKKKGQNHWKILKSLSKNW